MPDDLHISGAWNNPETNPVGNWPWMASIGKFHATVTAGAGANGIWQHLCGATLISKSYIHPHT